MAAIVNDQIIVYETEIQIANNLLESAGTSKPPPGPVDQIILAQHHDSFSGLIGTSPKHSLLASTAASTKNPLFHAGCVFIPQHDELYITSNLLQAGSSANLPIILMSRIKLRRSEEDGNVHAVEWTKLRPPPRIDMPRGGANLDDGILFCVQGMIQDGTGGLYLMPRNAPPRPVVTNFHGRSFNSVSDVAVTRDGCFWFTDPSYGHDQEFRRKPKLPNLVYRYDPRDGDIRVVADGFERPNGICFNPEETIVYITDADSKRGDWNKDLLRAATIYAFDVTTSSGGPFLINRRVFAYAVSGFPQGIKCDNYGNVYAGCGDGVEVWNPAGSLIGRILVPGGVTSFCFGQDGEMFLCAELSLWRLQLARTTKGALIGV